MLSLWTQSQYIISSTCQSCEEPWKLPMSNTPSLHTRCDIAKFAEILKHTLQCHSISLKSAQWRRHCRYWILDSTKSVPIKKNRIQLPLWLWLFCFDFSLFDKHYSISLNVMPATSSGNTFTQAQSDSETPPNLLRFFSFSTWGKDSFLFLPCWT